MTVRWTVRAAEDRSRVAKPKSKTRLCVVATRPSPPAPAKKKAKSIFDLAFFNDVCPYRQVMLISSVMFTS